MFCTNCGKELYASDKFCSECGTKVRETENRPAEEKTYIPSFREEAAKKTSEISQAIAEENRKNNSESAVPVTFDWNLDGFPSNKPRKTEEIDFNWSSVVEKKSRVRDSEVVSPFAPLKKDVVKEEIKEEPIDFAAAEKKQAEEEMAREEKAKEEANALERAKAQDVLKTEEQTEEQTEEEPMSIEELERELFQLDNMQEKCVRQDDYKKNTAQLEKFYTYNQKNEAFQHLLDKEYERLKGMEQETAPVVNTAFEMKPVEVEAASEVGAESEADSVLDSVLEIKMEEEAAEEKTEEVSEASAEEDTEVQIDVEQNVTSATIDFSAIREEARSKKMKEAAEVIAAIETAEEILENVSEVSESVDEEVSSDLASISTFEEVTTVDEAAVAEETEEDAVAEEAGENLVDDETEKVDEAAEDEVLEPEKDQDSEELDDSEASEEHEETSEIEETAETETEESEEEPAEAEETLVKESEKEFVKEADTAADEDSENEKVTEEAIQNDEVEKVKLRYSDIFPRDEIEAADEQTEKAEKADKKTSTVAESLMFDDDDDDDDDDDAPSAGGVIMKVLIGILVVLIAVEAVLLGVKFIAPESGLAEKADEIINSVLAVFTGEDGSEAEITVTEQRISEIVLEVEKPDSIGQIEYEMSLKYDLSGELAFEDTASSAAFTDAVWYKGDSGSEVTYCEEIIETVVEYYGKWIDNNEDETLIGINKLEIGEIRTGELGYYVLHRLTFAAADGQEKSQICTAFIKISQENMEIDEVKEEVL